MKVYIAYRLDYSDSYIIKACSTREIAERVIQDEIKEMSPHWSEETRKQFRHEDYDIYEFEVLEE